MTGPSSTCEIPAGTLLVSPPLSVLPPAIWLFVSPLRIWLSCRQQSGCLYRSVASQLTSRPGFVVHSGLGREPCRATRTASAESTALLRRDVSIVEAVLQSLQVQLAPPPARRPDERPHRRHRAPPLARRPEERNHRRHPPPRENRLRRCYEQPGLQQFLRRRSPRRGDSSLAHESSNGSHMLRTAGAAIVTGGSGASTGTSS
jgi:hypothetical protein